MSEGNVTNLPTDSLVELRKSLSQSHKDIVRAVVAQYERDLIAALPEINAGVLTSDASGSFTSTLQVAKPSKKRNRFQAKLTPRVRIPREPSEFDMHLSDDGQLALGFVEGDDGSDDEGEE